MRFLSRLEENSSYFDTLAVWGTAALLLFYSFVYLLWMPYFGIATNGRRISSVPLASVQALGFSEGDEVLEFNGVDSEDYSADSRIKAIDPAATAVTLTIRDAETGEIISAELPVSVFERTEFMARLVSQWSYGWLLWLVALITYLFLRPRDARWRLLILFLCDLALILSTGLPASRHALGAFGWLKFTSWMFLPIALHLHLLYPERLFRPRNWMPRAMAGMYVLFFGIALWQAIDPLQTSLYSWPFLVGLVAILVLLLMQFIFRKEVRARLWVFFLIELAALLALTLAPAIGAFTGQAMPVLGTTLVVTPLIPLAYLYAAYRRQLWNLRARSNPVVAIYLFVILVVALAAIGFAVGRQWLAFEIDGGVFLLLALLLGILLSLTVYDSFARFVRNRVFGIQMASDELMLAFTQRIATRLTLSSLAALIRDEVLPNLLISQSMLLSWPVGRQPEVILQEGVSFDPQQSLVDSPLATLIETETWQFTDDIPLGWVRLAIPLHIGDERIGLWLLGEHDPDDFYLQDEIAVLEHFSHQIAVTLQNIYQSRRFMALYQTNISRHERQRSLLGQDLHDEVINQLSALVHKTGQTEVVDGINLAIDQLRDMISGLRPPMLNYGLYPALSQMVEDLRDRIGTGQRITFRVSNQMDRYHPIAEHQIYSIVQQAVENSLKHSGAERLIIEGQLSPDEVLITVRDDGHGFEMLTQPDLLELLQQKHFGLAGMYERAGLIDARLVLYTAPGAGTSVSLTWHPEDLDEEDIQFLMS